MFKAFSKIWIIVIIVVFITAGILVSKSSFLKIPVFSDLFYTRKIAELGIQIDSEAAESFVQKLGFSIKEGITPLMRPVPPEPITIETTDVEFTSWVHLICSKIRPISSGKGDIIPLAKPTEALMECPFENFKVKFESGKIRSFVHIFKPIEGDITVFGKVSKKNEKSIDLELEKVWLGDLPVPDIIREKIEGWAEGEINKRLQKMEYLRIDKIEVLDGKARFEGILSFFVTERIPGGWVKECEKAKDCGRDSCQQGRDDCAEITFLCLKNQCSSEVKKFPGYMCRPDGKCRDTCGNGICDSEYEELHCPRDCF